MLWFDLILVILFLLLIGIGIIFISLFVDPLERKGAVDNTFAVAEQTAVLQGVLRTTFERNGTNITLTDFIRTFDLNKEVYQQELQCRIYQRLKTRSDAVGEYYAFEITIEKPGQTLHYASPLTPNEKREARERQIPSLEERALLRTTIPGYTGSITITFRTGQPHLLRADWAPDHNPQGRPRCVFDIPPQNAPGQGSGSGGMLPTSSA